MEKTATDTGPRPTFEDHKDKYDLDEGKAPGHHNFGQRVSLLSFDTVSTCTEQS